MDALQFACPFAADLGHFLCGTVTSRTVVSIRPHSGEAGQCVVALPEPVWLFLSVVLPFSIPASRVASDAQIFTIIPIWPFQWLRSIWFL